MMSKYLFTNEPFFFPDGLSQRWFSRQDRSIWCWGVFVCMSREVDSFSQCCEISGRAFGEDVEVDQGGIPRVCASQLDGPGAVSGVDLDHGDPKCVWGVGREVDHGIGAPVAPEGERDGEEQDVDFARGGRIVGGEGESVRVERGSGIRTETSAPEVHARITGGSQRAGQAGRVVFGRQGLEGLLGEADDGEFLVVCHVGAYAGKVDHHGDVEAGKLGFGANSGELEDLRGVEYAG